MGDMGRCVNRGVDGEFFVTRRIAGETIIVPVSGDVGDLEAAYTLNEVGSFIWQLIDGRRSVQAIAEAVNAEYDVTIERAVRDVDELLGTLESKGLVHPSIEQGRDA